MKVLWAPENFPPLPYPQTLLGDSGQGDSGGGHHGSASPDASSSGEIQDGSGSSGDGDDGDEEDGDSGELTDGAGVPSDGAAVPASCVGFTQGAAGMASASPCKLLSTTATTLVMVCGNDQSIPVGSYANFFVKAVDCEGTAMSGVNVLFQEPGQDTEGFVRTTDVDGLASATNFTSSAAGSYTETAAVVASTWAGTPGFVAASSAPVVAGTTVTFQFSQP
jgi:hypothetical protein